MRQVQQESVTEKEASDTLMKKYKEELPDFVADDIRQFEKYDPQTELRGQDQYDLANGELHPEDPQVQTVDISATADNRREIKLHKGDEDENGLAGYRDSSAYPDKNKVTAICEVPGAGAVSAWAELQCDCWIKNGGAWDVVWEFFENGLVAGGDCDYQIWIQEEGNSYKDFETVRSPGAAVNGHKERSRQYTFDDDTVYTIGFRLYTATSGVAKALVDFQTINADGSTRGLEDMAAYIDGNSLG